MERPTDREVQCLIVLARLGDPRKAAEELEVSLQTLKNHLLTLRRKLGAKNNLQAYDILVKGIKLSQTTTTEIKLEDS